MKISILLLVNTIVALIFGIAFVLVPGTVAGLYGVTPTPAVNLVGQFFGSALIAIGLVCWFIRNVTDAAALKAIVLAQLIANIIGLIISILGTVGGTINAVGWSSVVIYLVLALWFAYFQFIKRIS